MVPEAHQNDRSYVHELSGSTFDSHGGRLYEGSTLKQRKTVEIGGWALAQGWALVRDNTVIESL